MRVSFQKLSQNSRTNIFFCIFCQVARKSSKKMNK